MVVRHKLLSGLTVVTLLCSLLVLASENTVQAKSAAAAGTVVASGLNAPRFLAVNDDGSVYVTEAGKGGDEVLPTPPPGTPPLPVSPPGTPPPSRGFTGRVLKIGKDGSKTVIADKLPSYYTSEGATGPAGIVEAGGALWVVTGNVGAATPYPLKPLDNEGALVKVNIQTGAVTKVADVGAYEKANNPDKAQIDSDGYGLGLGADGNLYLADAAGNDLLKINPSTGAISLAAVFPHIPIPAGTPGIPPDTKDLEPVPTGVVGDTNGNIYVGFLSGVAPGFGKVVKVASDGKISDVATGLNPVVSVEIGPDHNLYATELVSGFGQQGPEPGRVLRILPDGTKQIVAEGLVGPNGVSFDKAGNMFVITGTAFAPSGSLMRFDNVAPPPVTTPPTLPNTGVAGPTLNFVQTGYSLSGAFLKFWQDNGGLAVFGYPIGSERLDNGQVYQWLERNRFEQHPENQAPYNVLLGRLGVEELSKQGIDWTTLPKVSSAPGGCMYFAQTGHSLCSDFMSYWQSHGLEFGDGSSKTFAESLALFGYPISEPKLETNSSGDTVLTQWFERARFEYHPNNPAEYRVLLGRLGAEVKG